MTYLSLDYGTSKTWLAYSVESFCFAWKTVPTRTLLEELPKYIREKWAKTLVIGMPYNIDGTMSKHGRRVQEFARKLEIIIEIPIVFHDERLSTSEARMSFAEDGEDGDIDSEAARLILIDYLKTLS
jgi:putative Holliday junction resolvase